MRLIVYFLSLLMIFMPSYSAYASGISKGQIIAIGKQGGAMIKKGGGAVAKVGQIGKVITPAGAVAWCLSNKKKCDDIIDDIAEIFCDDDGCTANRKDDGGDDGYCYSAGGRIWRTAQEACENISLPKPITAKPSSMQGNQGKCLITSAYNSKPYEIGYYSRISGSACGKSPPKDKRLSDDELNDLAKKIAEKMDNGDITNYYNTEYGDIIINNRKYDGDEINQQTNIDNKCQNNSCNELSKDVENAVRKGKIDIDDVNDKNCTLEKNTGKYIACNIDIDKDSDDSDTTNNTNKDDDDTTNNTDTKKDDDETSCDKSEFHKKICDWIDWTQKDLDEQDDGKAEIKDLSKDLELDDDKINFGRACPAGPVIDISFAGVSVYHQISYDGLCVSYDDMRPFVIGIGGIVSVMIIGGRRV